MSGEGKGLTMKKGEKETGEKMGGKGKGGRKMNITRGMKGMRREKVNKRSDGEDKESKRKKHI